MNFTDHTVETAPAKSKPALEGAKAKFGGIPKPLARLAESPTAVEAFEAMLGYFEGSSLNVIEREVVTLVVATTNECHFCIGLHSRIAAQVGMSTALIDALRAKSALPDARLETLRQFTVRVLATHGDVDDNSRAAWLAAGFTEQQALDVVVGIATYTLSTLANRLTRA